MSTMSRPAIVRFGIRPAFLPLLLTFLIPFALSQRARAADAPDASDILRESINRLLDLFEPPKGIPADGAPTVTAHIRFVRAAGLPREVDGASGDIAYQAPDRLVVHARLANADYSLGRDEQQVWVHEPDNKFAVLAKSEVQRFKADPTSIDDTVLPPFTLPISRLKLRLLIPTLVHSELLAPEKVDGVDCYVLRLTIRSLAAELAHINGGEVRIWVRQTDYFPARVTYTDGRDTDVQVDVTDPKASSDPLPAGTWKLAPNAGDDVQTVALSHIVRFLDVAPRIMNDKVPTLGPTTGKTDLIAKCGHGRLKEIDGTRVLFLKGTPEEMGTQQGTLLRSDVRDMAERVLYGVGVGSSFVKGKWFFGEVEGAEARLTPFMDPRYLREMDAMAAAAGMNPQEARLANFFPELFHCSGFALTGKAVADGHIYHGRVLDYMRGIGLEQNAAVTVYQPDQGYAWVNCGYAGFVGSVTAMNIKGISIGEMGGGGYGNWDGRPMAQLLREVMEHAATLDEAVSIMKNGPRTCQYYYVVSDGNSRTAVGIAATGDKFQVVKLGQFDPRLPHPIDDTVLLSAGDRYETLVQRVKDGFGKFDADSARALMNRPVCMTSNIQSVLFRPDTLDFWVANADSKNVASNTRYTHYNLRELIAGKAEPAVEAKRVTPEVGF
jgi:isopenicillin-N N-acyltransferase-like protein